MSARRVLSITGDVALELLRLTVASSDIFPPLKTAASGALHIAEIVSKFHSNKEEWQEFGAYVQDATARVIQSLAQTGASQNDIKARLEKLKTALGNTIERIRSEQAESLFIRFTRFMRDPEMIADMRKSLNDVIDLFEFSAITMTEINVHKILSAAEANSRLLTGIAQDTSVIVQKTASIDLKADSISRKVSAVALNATLEKLKRIQGASWDSARVCLPETRVKVIDDALAWVDKASESNGAQILLLTAVAGAGKSTVAHTIAQRCHKKGQLVSSFFFDHETAGRNNPSALFSTIAADLSRVSDSLAARITSAIEEDQGLPLAPMTRQFEELLLQPCQDCPVAGPLVIVIDALDEGWDDEMITIFQDLASLLPSSFRIILTSRMRPELDGLRRQAHVHSVSLDIDALDNMQDIRRFVTHKLKQLATARNLGDDWPGEELRETFEARADGLFLWVATSCDYLRKRVDPTVELRKLLSASSRAANSPEARMNKLYTTILESCDWDDEEFVAQYHRLMGTAIATKTPLTLSALNVLFHDQLVASSFVLQQLSPLLTGTDEGDIDRQPVRVLHQSLRDFLAIRAVGSPSNTRFQIVEKQHSQTLARLCLEILNRELGGNIVGTGYLANEESEVLGIPTMNDGQISEGLWYACQFWIDHLLDLDSSSSVTIKETLQSFLDSKAVLWIEVMAAKGRFRGLTEVRRWCEVRISCVDSPQDIFELRKCDAKHEIALVWISPRLEYEDRREEALASIEEAVELNREAVAANPNEFIPRLCLCLKTLSNCLSALGRREEALVVIQEAVVLCRQLVADRPTAFVSNLSASLNDLSNGLSNTGRYEEALVAIQEAVELRRQLAADRPSEFLSDLALSLNNVSAQLSILGRPEEALTAMQESLELYQQLSVDNRATFTCDFARSFHNLSLHLSDLGRYDEALDAIEKAVDLRRKLAADRPAAFTPCLADSLNNLTNHLSKLGRREEALAAAQEAVEFYRKLATDRPAAYNHDLAMSLNNLSGNLSYLGRREEALAVIQEAVELRRQLAMDRPAAFASELASSLNNLSTRSSELGRHEEALAAIQQAVELYRQLATDRPAAFIPTLALSLSNLSVSLSDLGQVEEALAAIQEAVEFYRKLAADRPAAFIPDLALSLNNLSADLFNLGRYEEALKAIQEAVELRRQLIADCPAAFTPNLAGSLNNLSVYLSDLGRREEALVAIHEVVELYRQLATDRPAAFVPDLALSLNNLSNSLSGLGRYKEALVAIQEAVELRRQLAADCPAAFAPDLAGSLNNLANRLSNLDRREEALAAIQEAVVLYRQLAADRPAAFNPELALSLNNLSSCLSDLGRREEALAAVQEATELRRQLAASRPAALVSDLALSLNNLSNSLSDLGRYKEALALIQEAVELYRQLAADRPAAFAPDLAESLDTLSSCLAGLGRPEEALVAIREVVQLRRSLAGQYPLVFIAKLTQSLRQLSHCLRQMDCHDEALGVEEEAGRLRD